MPYCSIHWVQPCSHNINSISLHALAESYDKIQPPNSSENGRGSLEEIKQAMSESYHQNEAYVKEVVLAARAIGLAVIDELLPDNKLKFMPVRTYGRILSSAVALWKVTIIWLFYPSFLYVLFSEVCSDIKFRHSHSLYAVTTRAIHCGLLDQVAKAFNDMCSGMIFILLRLGTTLEARLHHLSEKNTSTLHLDCQEVLVQTSTNIFSELMRRSCPSHAQERRSNTENSDRLNPNTTNEEDSLPTPETNQFLVETWCSFSSKLEQRSCPA